MAEIDVALEAWRATDRLIMTLARERDEARDRASTSYRDGYEARIAEEKRVGVVLVSEKPVLASNPLDPKCTSIFEAAEILASVTACMSNLAKALEEMSEKAEAAEKRAWDAEMASALRRSQVWEADSQVVTLREHLRLMTKERDEWRGEARALREARDLALERAERAEKMLTTERRS